MIPLFRRKQNQSPRTNACVRAWSSSPVAAGRDAVKKNAVIRLAKTKRRLDGNVESRTLGFVTHAPGFTKKKYRKKKLKNPISPYVILVCKNTTNEKTVPFTIFERGKLRSHACINI